MRGPFASPPSARELRRLQKRYESRGIKPRSDRHEVINPVTEAVIRVRIEEDIQRLRTDAGLQAFMGDDAARIASMAGRLVYIVSFAAGLHNLGDTPEARILAGTANALADIAETPAELERQRGAVIAGLQAMLSSLEGLVCCCHGDENPECPILDGLAQENGCVVIKKSCHDPLV